MEKKIVMITGGPGTGKSYMAKRIMETVKGLTFLSYDTVKEHNFDKFGFNDEKEKEELNRFSLTEFYLYVKKAMENSESILTEYPFYQRHGEKLEELIEKNGYQAYTLYLYGEWETIYRRGILRDGDGKRHPGHLTNCYHKETEDGISSDGSKKENSVFLSFDDFRKMMKEKEYNIALGTVISVDVTDYTTISYNKIIESIYLCH